MNEQQRELEYKQHQSKEYEAKLSNLQEHVRVETERGEKLDQTLVECQEEMKVYIEQLNEMKQQHEYDINNKITEVVLVLAFSLSHAMRPGLQSAIFGWQNY